MPPLTVRVGFLLALVSIGHPLAAQDENRIWGTVTTVGGQSHTGFLRWDRNEGSWADLLDGSKVVPDAHYQDWLAHAGSGERPVRTLDVAGYRVSWNEEDPDFPLEQPTGVRFGHLRSLVVTGTDEVEIELKSGERLTLSGGSTDIGTGIRELLVTDRDGDETELDWSELEGVAFSAVPTGVRAPSARLYGTVRDVEDNTYTGYISWDLDEIVEADILDGDDPDGDRKRIPFGDIASIEGGRRGSTVTLTSGEALELDDSNDVERGNRGIQVSDPSLGMVEVEWGEFAFIEFTPAPAPVTYAAFDGGHRLRGTVTTQSGEEYSGRIRWDAESVWSWEFLEGRRDDVKFTIEFGKIAAVQRAEVFGVEVTLTDGRALELEDHNDVDWDNRGIFVELDTETVRYVPWDDFARVRFDHGMVSNNTGGVGR